MKKILVLQLLLMNLISITYAGDWHSDSYVDRNIDPEKCNFRDNKAKLQQEFVNYVGADILKKIKAHFVTENVQIKYNKKFVVRGFDDNAINRYYNEEFNNDKEGMIYIDQKDMPASITINGVTREFLLSFYVPYTYLGGLVSIPTIGYTYTEKKEYTNEVDAFGNTIYKIMRNCEEVFGMQELFLYAYTEGMTIDYGYEDNTHFTAW